MNGGRLGAFAGAILVAGVLLLWAGAYLAASRRSAGELGFPLDDAWIHARIARNLANGHGFTFNPGEPTGASSAPLWTLLLAIPIALGIPIPWAGYVLGAASASALTCVVFVLARRLTGEARLALVAALLIGCTHPFPWIVVSGMEPALAAALVVSILLLAHGGRPGACLALSVAAALTRPELIPLPALVLIDALL